MGEPTPGIFELLCANQKCQQTFTVPIPHGRINNGTPFCVVIYGQPPVQCPHCKQTYIFQLTEILDARFQYVPVEVKDASKIIQPPPGMKIPDFKM